MPITFLRQIIDKLVDDTLYPGKGQASTDLTIDGQSSVDIVAFKDRLEQKLIALSRPPSFLVYTALLTQEGEDAPVATILENTIGVIVWTRTNIGEYLGTLAGAFTEDYTALQISPGSAGLFGVQWLSVNEITVSSRLLAGDEADEMLFKHTIEIKVYI